MAQAASGAAGLSSLLGPIGALGGLGLSAFSAFSAGKAAKKANRANEQRYQQLLNLLRTQGESTKADIARGGKEERGAIGQSLIGRGLYNTNVLDSLQGESLSREQRNKAGVDEGVAAQLAGVMERRTDAAPDPSQAYAGLAQSAGQFGQTLATALGPSQEEQYAKLRALIRSEDAKDLNSYSGGFGGGRLRLAGGGSSFGAANSELGGYRGNLYSYLR